MTYGSILFLEVLLTRQLGLPLYAFWGVQPRNKRESAVPLSVCFQQLVNCPICKPFVLITMQQCRGWGGPPDVTLKSYLKCFPNTLTPNALSSFSGSAFTSSRSWKKRSWDLRLAWKQPRAQSLRVIRWSIEKRRQQWLTLRLRRFLARTIGHVHVVNPRQGFVVVHLEDPAVLRRIIHIEGPQAPRTFLALAFLSPGLEYRSALQTLLQIQVEGIENQRLPFRIENPSKRPLQFALPANVVHINNVQAPRPQYVSNVVIGCQQLLLPLRVFHLGKRLLRQRVIPRCQPGQFLL